LSGPTILEVVGKVERSNLALIDDGATVIEDDDGDYKLVQPADDEDEELSDETTADLLDDFAVHNPEDFGTDSWDDVRPAITDAIGNAILARIFDAGDVDAFTEASEGDGQVSYERVDPEFETLPSDVWREAHHLTPPTPEYHDVDEARYHPGTNTVLLRRDSELATVLVMTESEMVTDGGEEE